MFRKMAEEAIEVKKAREASEPSYLPHWPDSARPLPNSIARSALFAVSRRGGRDLVKDSLIASRGDTRILFTGELLNQDDADVWLHVLQVAKNKPLGERVCFNRTDFLDKIGWKRGKNGSFPGPAYEWLHTTLQRLTQALFTIKTRRFFSTFHLIDAYDHDTETGEYWLSVSPKAIDVFEGYAYVNWESRKLLPKGDKLARWLQGYICSHAKGEKHAISIELLKTWSGCEKSRLRDFRDRALPRALCELEKVKIIQDVLFNDDCVSWVRLDDAR